jgi:type VI secretion system secreted protein VgrG
MFRRLLISLVTTLALAAPLTCLRQPQAGAQQPYARPLDYNRYPAARLRAVLARGFPRLTDFEVVDPTVGQRYNCIAHSLGIHSYWVNPRTGPAESPLLYMDRIYRTIRYTRVPGLDFRLVRGLKKVVVYAHVSGGRIREVTHAALQEADGTWTSKLGQLPLIRHRTPQDLSGPSYGQPVAVYLKRG